MVSTDAQSRTCTINPLNFCFLFLQDHLLYYFLERYYNHIWFDNPINKTWVRVGGFEFPTPNKMILPTTHRNQKPVPVYITQRGNKKKFLNNSEATYVWRQLSERGIDNLTWRMHLQQNENRFPAGRNSQCIFGAFDVLGGMYTNWHVFWNGGRERFTKKKWALLEQTNVFCVFFSISGGERSFFRQATPAELLK